MLAGQARTVTVQAAWLASTSPQMGRHSVCRVEHIHTPTCRVTTLRPVCAMLVGWDETATVQHVWLANIRPALGLLCALTVHPGNIQMLLMHPKTRATNVQLARIRNMTGPSVFRVQRIHTLRQKVTTLRPVCAMLVGWDETATVQHAWLANIRPPLGLLCALTVGPGNIQMLSMHPKTRAANVQVAHTRQTTCQSVCCV